MVKLSGSNGLLLLLIQIFFQPATVRAFTLSSDSRPGEAVSSHSGPTNALYGHEQFHDEPLSEEQRHKRNAMWGNNFFYQNNGWPSLLISSDPPSQYMKGSLTGEHNRYRRMVPATDMRMIYWSEELAASAQRHANRCDFRHSRDRVNVGENIWAAPYTNYSDAIVRWFDEVNNPRCGCSQGYKHCCGHYIQLVWARTNLVGCGYARCRDVWGVLGRGHQNVFVCHYNPQGNRPFQAPAFTWAYNPGQRCSQCPEDAPACYDNLCYMPENYVAPNSNTTTVPTNTNNNGYRYVNNNNSNNGGYNVANNSNQNGGNQNGAQNGAQNGGSQQNNTNNTNGSNTNTNNNNQNGNNNDVHRMGNQWDSQSKTENNRISQNTVE